VMMCKNCCCSWCGAVLDVWVLLSWYYPSGRVFGIAGCCGAASSSLSCSD
jgi:hypothetical protein